MNATRAFSVAVAATLFALPAAAQESGGDAALPQTWTNPIGMEFVLIQPGSFTAARFQPECGSPPSAADAGGGQAGGTQRDPRTVWSEEDYARCEALVREDARQGFSVTIAEPFYIGVHEVTQAQWARVMGSNPSVFQGDRVDGDAGQHPVDNVTWEDAQEFIRRLNELDPSSTYRLPSEFEWEYAARAGADGDMTWADARAQAQTSRASTLPVAQKEPNAWGLYDMVGNVWEWVEDWYNEHTFPDPSPPSTGTVHVLKGGGFLSDVKNLTYTTHAGGPANGWDVGFRVVRTPGAEP